MLICTIGKTALHYEYRCVKDSASAMARMEVSGGKVGRVRADEPEPGRQCLWQL
jgi:hypothetical protein